MDNLSIEHDPTQDLLQAEHQLVISFEAMTRVMDSFEALNQFIEAGEQLSAESFESLARPMMLGILGGTDVQIEDFSLEATKGAAGGAVKAILTAIANFFRALMDFLTNVDLSATWLMRKAIALEKKASATRGLHATEPTITLGRQNRYLRVGRDFPEDGLRLETELKTLKDAVSVIGHDYLNAIIAAADRLPSAVRGGQGTLEGDALQRALVGLVTAIPFDSLAGKLDMKAASFDRFTRKGVQCTEPLLGGKSIFYLKADLQEKGIKAIKFHGFLYESMSRQDPAIANHRDFATLKPSDLGIIPTQVKDLLAAVSKGSSSSARNQVARARQTLDNFVKSQHGSSTDIDAIRKVVASLTYWMHTPARPLFTSVMGTCRAVMAYCDQSIATYK